jgi:hypothetical protein
VALDIQSKGIPGRTAPLELVAMAWSAIVSPTRRARPGERTTHAAASTGDGAGPQAPPRQTEAIPQSRFAWQTGGSHIPLRPQILGEVQSELLEQVTLRHIWSGADGSYEASLGSLQMLPAWQLSEVVQR